MIVIKWKINNNKNFYLSLSLSLIFFMDTSYKITYIGARIIRLWFTINALKTLINHARPLVVPFISSNVKSDYMLYMCTYDERCFIFGALCDRPVSISFADTGNARSKIQEKKDAFSHELPHEGPQIPHWLQSFLPLSPRLHPRR